MSFKELKDKLVDLLSKDMVEDLIHLGRQWTKEDSISQRDLVQISGRYYRLRRNRRLSLITYENFSQEMNQISAALDLWMHDLTADDISTELVYPFPTLVISNNDGLSGFFDRTGLKGFVIEKREKFQQKDLEKYCLIIFDNDNLPPCTDPNMLIEKGHKKQVEIMGDYLEKGKEFIKSDKKGENLVVFLHYGDENYLVSEYRKYIHAANSIYSLYARIMEVLEFLRIDTPANYVKKD